MRTTGNFGWLGPDQEDIMVTNRAAATVAAGDQVMLDQRRTDADSTSNTPGIAASGVANVITPVATVASDLAAGIFGICLASAIDNGTLKIRLRGQCDVVNVAGTVVLATDDSYGPVTATRNVTKLASLDITSASTGRPRKVTFIPLTARTGAGATDGWFDGVCGFGYVLSVT